MKAEQIKKVVENHKSIDIDSRETLQEIVYVVEDLLEEEIKYLQENEPHAFITLDETKRAREVLRNIYHIIGDMDTGELLKAKVWPEG